MSEESNLWSKKDIADVLNLSERRVEQLAAKRILPKAARGKFELRQTVKAYCMYMQQAVTGGERIDVAKYKDRLLRATALEAEEKAKLREIMRREKEGELMERSEVVAQWTARCIELKAALLAIPVQVGFRFPDPDVRGDVEEEVEKAIYEILAAYSRDGIAAGSVDAGGTSGLEAAPEDERQ